MKITPQFGMSAFKIHPPGADGRHKIDRLDGDADKPLTFEQKFELAEYIRHQLSKLPGFKQVLFTLNDDDGYHETALRQMYKTLLEKFDDPTDAQREATEWATNDPDDFNKAAEEHRQADLN